MESGARRRTFDFLLRVAALRKIQPLWPLPPPSAANVVRLTLETSAGLTSILAPAAPCYGISTWQGFWTRTPIDDSFAWLAIHQLEVCNRSILEQLSTSKAGRSRWAAFLHMAKRSGGFGYALQYCLAVSHHRIWLSYCRCVSALLKFLSDETRLQFESNSPELRRSSARALVVGRMICDVAIL